MREKGERRGEERRDMEICMSDGEIRLREITSLPTLMMWRQEVIRQVFGAEPSKRLLVANRQYYREHIADGSHVALVASVGSEDVGCGAVCLTDELPSPDNPSGRCAYLMNIYVRESYRQHGVAHKIVSRLIEISREKGCDKIYLESTAEGRPVYRSLGFADMEGMMKFKLH